MMIKVLIVQEFGERVAHDEAPRVVSAEVPGCIQTDSGHTVCDEANRVGQKRGLVFFGDVEREIVGDAGLDISIIKLSLIRVRKIGPSDKLPRLAARFL
jgi:hypothetical protein